MNDMFSPHLKVALDSDEAYASTLDLLLTKGVDVRLGDSKSTGSGKLTKELLNFKVVLENPRERFIKNPNRMLNLPAAVARFIWMMAGSDRLADIAFYEPKVRFFTDDGISVPGSSYGQRILQPRPGLNQFLAVVDRLKEDHASRRAAIAIYHPEDSVRNSVDIPCAFGVFYHIRNNLLYSTTLMRSNNAHILMPYNLFEFSLLAEVVASEVGVNLGPLTHSVISMHIYENDFESSKKVIEGFKAIDSSKFPNIPEMPQGGAIEEIRKLVILEARLRHASGGIGENNIDQWIQEGENSLTSYWRQFYFLLLLFVVRQNGSQGAIDAIKTVIDAPWKNYLQPHDFILKSDEKRGDLSILELPAASSPKIIPFQNSRTHDALKKAVETWELKNGSVSWKEFTELETLYLNEIAARGDRDEIHEEELSLRLTSIRMPKEEFKLDGN